MVSGGQLPTDMKRRAVSNKNELGACARGMGLTFADEPASRLASISLNLDVLEPIKCDVNEIGSRTRGSSKIVKPVV